jgi:5-methylcytosine-specific restriction endonuclease McrA
MPSDYERIPTALRQEIAQRAKHRCEYCRCPDEFSPDSFTVDHIKPRQLGGATTTENLAWACFGCNGRKYTRTVYADPKTGQEIALFNPRQQNWTEHFDWGEDFSTTRSNPLRSCNHRSTCTQPSGSRKSGSSVLSVLNC